LARGIEIGLYVAGVRGGFAGMGHRLGYSNIPSSRPGRHTSSAAGTLA
jgi:hypothetical protein